MKKSEIFKIMWIVFLIAFFISMILQTYTPKHQVLDKCYDRYGSEIIGLDCYKGVADTYIYWILSIISIISSMISVVAWAHFDKLEYLKERRDYEKKTGTKLKDNEELY